MTIDDAKAKRSELAAALQARAQEHLTELRRLVEIESVSAEGRAIDDAASSGAHARTGAAVPLASNGPISEYRMALRVLAS